MLIDLLKPLEDRDDCDAEEARRQNRDDHKEGIVPFVNVQEVQTEMPRGDKSVAQRNCVGSYPLTFIQPYDLRVFGNHGAKDMETMCALLPNQQTQRSCLSPAMM